MEVDHGGASRPATFEFYRDERFSPLDDVWVDEGGDRAGVVDWWRVELPDPVVRRPEEAHPLGADAADGVVHCPHPLDNLSCGKRLMGQVESDHPDRYIC